MPKTKDLTVERRKWNKGRDESRYAFCISETTLQEVAQMMIDHDCGEIPVVENQKTKLPIGVITDRDIVCRTVARGLNPLDLAVGDCMSKPCVTVTPDMSIEECTTF